MKERRQMKTTDAEAYFEWITGLSFGESMEYQKVDVWLAACEYKSKQLEAKLAEAVEVIKFYGNTENWMIPNDRITLTEVVNDYDTIPILGYYSCTGGRRARAFLEKMEKEK